MMANIQERAIIFKTTIIPLEIQQQHQEGQRHNHKGIHKTTKSAALEEGNH
jgi:hypothetical protein